MVICLTTVFSTLDYYKQEIKFFFRKPMCNVHINIYCISRFDEDKMLFNCFENVHFPCFYRCNCVFVRLSQCGSCLSKPKTRKIVKSTSTQVVKLLYALSVLKYSYSFT